MHRYFSKTRNEIKVITLNVYLLYLFFIIINSPVPVTFSRSAFVQSPNRSRMSSLTLGHKFRIKLSVKCWTQQQQQQLPPSTPALVQSCTRKEPPFPLLFVFFFSLFWVAVSDSVSVSVSVHNPSVEANLLCPIPDCCLCRRRGFLYCLYSVFTVLSLILLFLAVIIVLRFFWLAINVFLFCINMGTSKG